ncbi:MAG: HlyD family efflux transporter periplasmic adaptor subunit [Algicola sp.]|nr:HlyD family efflux transporter periplasmic adaptor subunit [Algicola sp.]
MAIALADSKRALEKQLSTKLDVVHLVLGLFLISLAFWAAVGKIDLYRTSKIGTLINVQGVLTLQSEVASTIRQSALTLGMKVKKGQLLLQLNDTTAQLTLSKLNDELTANQQQQTLLVEQRQLTQQKYQLLKGALQSQIAQIKAQLVQTSKMLKTQQSIQQGYRTLMKTSAVAQMDMLRQNLEVVRTESVAKTQALEVQAKELQLPRNEREQDLEISQINSRLSALEGQHEQLKRAITRALLEVDKYTLTAAADGDVVQLAALTVGNWVNVGDQIATIGNSSSWLIHSQFDAADAVGHIKDGQQARILVNGFPWRQYGSLNASVSHVAKIGLDSHVDVMLELNPNQQSQIPLTYGQPVTVEVQTEALSPIMLLLNAADRAMRKQSEKAI